MHTLQLKKYLNPFKEETWIPQADLLIDVCSVLLRVVPALPPATRSKLFTPFQPSIDFPRIVKPDFP